MIKIPKNVIPKIEPFTSDSVGDFSQTFNIDLSRNYGAMRPTGMFMGGSLIDNATPTALSYYDDKYYLVSGGYVYEGGNAPDDTFSRMTGGSAPTDISSPTADLELFNGSLYVSGVGDGDGISKLSSSTWSVVSASGLNSSVGVHLLKSFGGLLYVSDANIIGHITSGDVLNLSGDNTFNPGLDSDWEVTMLEASFDSLWVGYLNTSTGRGLVYEWDGASTNTAIRKYELEAGVIAGTVAGNIPYVFDSTGRLLRYAGTSFVPVGEIDMSETRLAFDGLLDGDESVERPVHPNGMTVTEDGKILILFKNTLVSGVDYVDNSPSGVYEYDPNIGMYHKYSIPVGTYDGYGSHRLVEVGGLFFRKPNTSPPEGGTFLAGAAYTDTTGSTAYGLFYDDSLNERQKWGHFITTKIFTDSENVFQKIQAVYKRFLTSTDKCVVKYRVEDYTPVDVTCSWQSSTKIETTTDVSAFNVGDEITVLTGDGCGKSAHITKIQTLGDSYILDLDESFLNSESSAGFTGGTSVIRFDKWIKAGTISSNDSKDWKSLTLALGNIGIWIRLKVCVQSTGNNEIHRLKIINKSHINE